MENLTPVTRVEQFLQEIIDNGGGGGGGSGGGGGLVVTVANDALDKTWNEINAARLTGAVVLNGFKDQNNYDVVAYLKLIASENGYYFADFYYFQSSIAITKSFMSDSATGQMVLDN